MAGCVVLRRSRRSSLGRPEHAGPWKEGSIHFVAQDSQGQCFLWTLRWGEAGYGCRSTRLTLAEAEDLYQTLARTDDNVSRSACDAVGYSDPAPRHASFTREESAQQFFATDRDPDLRRWARAMFQTIRGADNA